MREVFSDIKYVINEQKPSELVTKVNDLIRTTQSERISVSFANI